MAREAVFGFRKDGDTITEFTKIRILYTNRYQLKRYSGRSDRKPYLVSANFKLSSHLSASNNKKEIQIHVPWRYPKSYFCA